MTTPPLSDQANRDASVRDRAARHALDVHEDRATGPLTPYGIATCAASAAIVLMDETHPNHDWLERRIAALGKERDQ